jgi:hypothetical protein
MLDPISDVPETEVGEVVDSFIRFDGVKELKVEKQGNGKFTITPLG